MSILRLLPIAAFVVLFSPAAPAFDGPTDRYERHQLEIPGLPKSVTVFEWKRTGGVPLAGGRAWVAKFDLSDPKLRFVTRLGLDNRFGKGNPAATVGDMAAALEKEGRRPVVGINGNFFDTASGIINVYGPVISDGKVLIGGGGMLLVEDERHEFAFRSDNRIGHNGAFTADGRRILNATGFYSEPIIRFREGEYRTLNNPTYPRTLVGVGEKTLAFLVSDGRQPRWSLGVDDRDAVDMLRAAGCHTVAEGDGGGSSSMWIRGLPQSLCPRDAGYVNRASDGHPRKVGEGVFMLYEDDDAAGLGYVDPMIGTEGVGSEYGGMMPMTGMPFGSMHIVPMTRTNGVGRTSFNALDRQLLGFILTRQPAIWMGEFGQVCIPLAKPLPLESVDAHPWLTVVKAGGKRFRIAARGNSAVIESDDPGFGARFPLTGVTTQRTCRVSTSPIPNFKCHWAAKREAGRLAVGVSLISAENARRFLEEADSVDGCAKAARGRWSDLFGHVVIDASESVKRIFYTGLYHALLYPRDFTEFGSHYSAMDDKVHQGGCYSCFSLWDTYRSAHPLYALLYPRLAGEFCDSLVTMYHEGGWLPIWPNPGYTGVMIGDPAAIVLSEAYVKGIGGFDAKAALAACLKNADVPQPDDQTRDWHDSGADTPGCPETRGGLTWYLKNGWVAHDMTSESVSRTLDYSLADSSIARFAGAMGRQDVVERFERRAKNYRNLWNADQACFLPRTHDGTWCDAVHHEWGTYGYTETNERSARWCVPHDVDGLIELMGGKQVFERELDRFFAEDFWKTDTVGNKSVHGNETCHHVAYLYNRIGCYDKTCRRVREILEKAYSTNRRGFDGNEDCGAMSAWYILSALGLYPLDPASGDYELGSPVVRSAVLRLSDGALRITVRGSGVVVKRVSFNGRELKNRRIAHRELVKGGELVFETGK